MDKIYSQRENMELCHLRHDLANHFVTAALLKGEGKDYLRRLYDKTFFEKEVGGSEKAQLKRQLWKLIDEWEDLGQDRRRRLQERILKNCEASFMTTGSKCLDVLLMAKQGICIQKEIQARIQIQIPKTMDFEEDELVSLFGNLLDNGIRACGENGRLCLITGFRTGFWQIRMKNSLDGEQESKKEKKSGYGLKIIEKTVKKYGGDFLMERKEKSMVSVLMFPAWESEKEWVEKHEDRDMRRR